MNDENYNGFKKCQTASGGMRVWFVAVLLATLAAVPAGADGDGLAVALTFSASGDTPTDAARNLNEKRAEFARQFDHLDPVFGATDGRPVSGVWVAGGDVTFTFTGSPEELAEVVSAYEGTADVYAVVDEGVTGSDVLALVAVVSSSMAGGLLIGFARPNKGAIWKAVRAFGVLAVVCWVLYLIA